jgi:hypothetical protein
MPTLLAFPSRMAGAASRRAVSPPRAVKSLAPVQRGVEVLRRAAEAVDRQELRLDFAKEDARLLVARNARHGAPPVACRRRGSIFGAGADRVEHGDSPSEKNADWPDRTGVSRRSELGSVRDGAAVGLLAVASTVAARPPLRKGASPGPSFSASMP